MHADSFCRYRSLWLSSWLPPTLQSLPFLAVREYVDSFYRWSQRLTALLPTRSLRPTRSVRSRPGALLARQFSSSPLPRQPDFHGDLRSVHPPRAIIHSPPALLRVHRLRNPYSVAVRWYDSLAGRGLQRRLPLLQAGLWCIRSRRPRLEEMAHKQAQAHARAEVVPDRRASSRPIRPSRRDGRKQHYLPSFG